MIDDITRIEAHTLIGAYVLDAVTDAERRVFEEHLAGCSGCAQEVAELRETTALLAGGAEVTPPAGLKDRVLTAVAHTRQVPPDPPRAAGGRGGRWRRATAITTAAAVAVVVALGVHTAAANDRLERQLQALRQVEAESGRFAEVLAAPDAKLVRGEVTGGGSGTAVASRTRGQVVFLAHGLAELPEDRAYQLWLIGADGPRPAGLLSGSGGRPLPLLANGFTGPEAVGLTVEPRGGSARPTTPAVVVLPMV
ncbi:anti-sigma factor [Saccharothrix mutabilis subsp. mutabilis]|uniref:Regulator of SigK n=1 Tax=Saccharothrix mutabilis subsp. mutabilis TaxID=66855 RepID=A0ABP3DYZ7_9PSEU